MTDTNAGRAYEGKSSTEDNPRGTTIACTKGFPIKIPTQSIELITPCRANKYNPNGYRILRSTGHINCDGLIDKTTRAQ